MQVWRPALCGNQRFRGGVAFQGGVAFGAAWGKHNKQKSPRGWPEHICRGKCLRSPARRRCSTWSACSAAARAGPMCPTSPRAASLAPR
eukprot:3430053-Prymnesium_polylepis.1